MRNSTKHPKYHVRDSLKCCLAMPFFLLWLGKKLCWMRDNDFSYLMIITIGFNLILLEVVNNIYTVHAASRKYCSWWCQWWKIDLLWFRNDGKVLSLSFLYIYNMVVLVKHIFWFDEYICCYDWCCTLQYQSKYSRRFTWSFLWNLWEESRKGIVGFYGRCSINAMKNLAWYSILNFKLLTKWSLYTDAGPSINDSNGCSCPNWRYDCS